MAHLHFAHREITLNVIYIGPPQAGSGSNVRHLHRAQPAREKAELRTSGDGDPATWWFSYHPAERPRITGFDVRVRLVSVPSVPSPPPDRDAQFEGVDGVVFVADARANRSDENTRAFLDLERTLARHGLDLGAIPIVIQVNQTDAANARPAARVIEELNPFGFPVVEANARKGKGVLETHGAILGATLSRLRDNFSGNETALTVTALSRFHREEADAAISRHAERLPQAHRPVPERFAPAARIVLRPEELRESFPTHLIRAELAAERLTLEVGVRRADGTHRKLALLIEPGGDTATPVPESTSGRTGGTPLEREAVSAAASNQELGAFAYGLVGLLGGVAIGFLGAYLLFA